MRAGEFHCARRGTQVLDGLTLAESEYAPGRRLDRHAHAHPFFSLLVRGSFRERLEHGQRECVPTSLVFYPEHEPHEEAFGPLGGRAFHVEMGGPWLGRMKAEGMGYASGSVETLTGRLNLLMTRLYVWFLMAGPHVAAEEIVLEMLADVSACEALGHESQAPDWLGRVRDILHVRYRETVAMAELADIAGVHPVHLARVFRRHHGCTVGSYVRTLRIEHARMALADASRSISSIALATGFSDQAHLTRHFKAQIGVPPGTYRRLALS